MGGVGNSWILRSGLEHATAFELYVVSLYIALNNVFGSTPEINPVSTDALRQLQFHIRASVNIPTKLWQYAARSRV